jgi:hypothetical protein
MMILFSLQLPEVFILPDSRLNFLVKDADVITGQWVAIFTDRWAVLNKSGTLKSPAIPQCKRVLYIHITHAFPVVFELVQSHLQLDQENAKWFETAHVGWRLFTIAHNHHQRMNTGLIGDGHARKIGGRSSEQNSGGAGSASGQKSVTGNRMNKKL